MSQSPTLTIIAGANGSGKTTFARPYVKAKGVQFINADDLTKAYEERGEPNAMMKGGREFFKLLNGAMKRLEDVVIETTLSGTYTTKVVRRAKALGYTVKMIYIFLPSDDDCVERVKIRVKVGGHEVPEEDIRRRYYRSINNFREEFIHSTDGWELFYNGGSNHKKVAERSLEQTEVIEHDLWQFFHKIKTDGKG